MQKFNTKEKALESQMFFLDISWLPRMLVENVDKTYSWIGLGQYQGKSRGPMSKKEIEEALARAPMIRRFDGDDYVYEHKRGILVQDARGDMNCKKSDILGAARKEGWDV
jgi:hypothetical protein